MREMTDIPTISLAALRRGDAIEDLARACERWGFFQLVDHGIPGSGRREFMNQVQAFFHLPTDTKASVKRSDRNPWGFYDQELTKNRQDWKEIFDFGVDHEDSRSQWPDGLPGFRQEMMAWFEASEGVSAELLQYVCHCLDLPADQLTPHFEPDHTSFLRLNYYPPCDDPAGSEGFQPESGHLGISHHSDAGALTLLVQDSVDGLQVWHGDQWITVKAIDDAFIVNIGDLVEVWSNGRFRAPLHRVLANSISERFSAPFFYNPSTGTDVVPLVGTRPEFRSVNWGEFRAARAAGDYADQGQEAQISDYRI